MAVRFDEARLEIRGDPVVLVERVSGDPRAAGSLNLSTVANGTLVIPSARRLTEGPAADLG